MRNLYKINFSKEAFLSRLKNKVLKQVLLISIISSASLTVAGQTESILHNGIQRTYMIHLPTGFSSSDTLPVVFSLHGLVMTAQSQSDLSQFDPIADRERFIVIYPQGLPNSTGLNSWNTFSSPYHSGVDDVGFISALIDTLFRDYHINLNRVYSCGMSNGGFMSYRLACELSDRIAAIASVTGCMTDSMTFYCNPSRPFPILHFHGTSDPIVAYGGGAGIKSVDASLQYWIQNNSCPTTPNVDSVPDINVTDGTTVSNLFWGPCDNNTEVIHYKVEGGGHTWPGSPEDFFGVGGNINLDIMASELIWEFFNKYTLPEISTDLPSQLIESSIITIYPNPVDDVLNVLVTNDKLRKINLTDIAGNEILAMELNTSESFSLNLGNLPAGMYILFCETVKEAKVFKVLRR